MSGQGRASTEEKTKKNPWHEGLTPEALPEAGHLRLVAERCGMGVAISLAEELAGMQIYIASPDNLVADLKKQYIHDKSNGTNHEALALETGYSLRWVYEILRGEEDVKQDPLF